MQSTWDALESRGRIKIVLSEQLIQKTGSPQGPVFGEAFDIVCFSFQHAPRGTSYGYETSCLLLTRDKMCSSKPG